MPATLHVCSSSVYAVYATMNMFFSTLPLA